MRWENQDGPGPSPTTSSIELAARRALEASRARRAQARPTRREVLEAAAPAIIIVLGFIALYVLAGVLTGGPR